MQNVSAACVHTEAGQRGPALVNRPDPAFLALHFGPEASAGQTRRGQILVSMIGPSGTMKQIGTYKAGRDDALKQLRLAAGSNFYITPNQMKGNARGTDQIFAFQNIVVDVDAHAEGLPLRSIDTAADQLIAALRGWISDPDKLAPNTVTRTGRGLQLWYALEPLPAKSAAGATLAFLYEKLRDRILDEVDELLASLPYASRIFGQIDRAASSNAAGVCRIPGSYNSKSRSWSRCEILHRKRLHVGQTVGPIERSGAGLRKDGRLYPRTAAQIKAAAAKHWNIEQGVQIIEILSKLRELRRKAGTESAGNEHRNSYIYTLYASLLPSFSDSMAWAMIETFNDGFIRPLSRSGLKQATAWTAKHNRNGLTNAKIIETLGITPAEQAALHFYAAGSDRREAEREAARERKRERNEKILTLREEGLKIAEIAQSVGCCLQTVENVLKRYSRFISSEERARRILWLLDDGHTPAEISDLVGCCVRTVYNVKNKAHEERACESTPAEASKTPQNAPKLSDDQTQGQAEERANEPHTAARETARKEYREPAVRSAVLPILQKFYFSRYTCLSGVAGTPFLWNSGLYPGKKSDGFDTS